jgi:hypothetical protein
MKYADVLYIEGVTLKLVLAKNELTASSGDHQCCHGQSLKMIWLNKK